MANHSQQTKMTKSMACQGHIAVV